MDKVMMILAWLVFLWAWVFMYHFVCYCKGDKSLALDLIDNLSKNPSAQKKNPALQVGAGGGILFMYSCIYPFCRHRRKNKSLSFDLFMWTNWLFFILCFLFIYSARNS
ncbi:hypothetical protein [Moritella viscosa]|uniref:hypothetical protein n=1 Tax=Moritella viscosa TaxID=80854 RepID=UPI00094C1DD5|nr:hypothetical protein [Moritella viscosa]